MDGTVNISHDLWTDPAFKNEPFTERAAFLWLACKGRIVRATVGDLSREWMVHQRRAVQIIKSLERLGQISVFGTGKCRLICVSGQLVETCGFYISKEAAFPHGPGGSVWRGPPMSAALRLSILERDGHTCRYCGATDGPMHVDHIKPVALGGSDNPANLAAACATCNLSKGAKSLEEWKGRLL